MGVFLAAADFFFDAGGVVFFFFCPVPLDVDSCVGSWGTKSSSLPVLATLLGLAGFCCVSSLFFFLPRRS